MRRSNRFAAASIKNADRDARLRNANIQDKIQLVDLLGKVGTTRSLPALQPPTRDRDPGICKAAIAAIGQINQRKSNPQ